MAITVRHDTNPSVVLNAGYGAAQEEQRRRAERQKLLLDEQARAAAEQRAFQAREAAKARGFQGKQNDLSRAAEVGQLEARLTEAERERKARIAEAAKDRTLRTDEAEKNRTFQGVESEKDRTLRTDESGKNRTFQEIEAEKNREFQHDLRNDGYELTYQQKKELQQLEEAKAEAMRSRDWSDKDKVEIAKEIDAQIANIRPMKKVEPVDTAKQFAKNTYTDPKTGMIFPLDANGVPGKPIFNPQDQMPTVQDSLKAMELAIKLTTKKDALGTETPDPDAAKEMYDKLMSGAKRPQPPAQPGAAPGGVVADPTSPVSSGPEWAQPAAGTPSLPGPGQGTPAAGQPDAKPKWTDGMDQVSASQPAGPEGENFKAVMGAIQQAGSAEEAAGMFKLLGGRLNAKDRESLAKFIVSKTADYQNAEKQVKTAERATKIADGVKKLEGLYSELRNRPLRDGGYTPLALADLDNLITGLKSGKIASSGGEPGAFEKIGMLPTLIKGAADGPGSHKAGPITQSFDTPSELMNELFGKSGWRFGVQGNEDFAKLKEILADMGFPLPDKSKFK